MILGDYLTSQCFSLLICEVELIMGVMMKIDESITRLMELIFVTHFEQGGAQTCHRSVC